MVHEMIADKENLKETLRKNIILCSQKLSLIEDLRKVNIEINSNENQISVQSSHLI